MARNKNKSAKQKAHRLQLTDQPLPRLNLIATDDVKAAAADDDEENDEALIGPDDLETAILVLETLVDEPDLLSNQRYKQLKRVGWDFGKALAEQGSGAGASIHSKISHLLSLSLYRQALVLLFDLYVNKTPTKLGSLQRWVRDCDATSQPGKVLTEQENEERNTVLKCLDMVLRVCGDNQGDHKGKGKEMLEDLEEDGQSQVIRRIKVWNVKNEIERNKIQDEISLWSLIQKGSEGQPTGTVPSFYPIQITPGPLRRPPNVYPSTVHASRIPSPIPFPSSSHEPFSVSHPLIPTCSLILNVLPPTTCETIVETANKLGWEPDQAAGGSAVDKTSVLAHNVVWLADEQFVNQLFEKIKPFVKEKVGGGKVRGINRRFRVYRYGPKQVYRPHIDGAWPAAGIDAVTGEYLHDSSPSDDPLWSRYTLLIYLNSDINAPSPACKVPGATTFFLPSPSSISNLLACPIAPVQGAVLVFPHGDASSSLLHEGSPVGDGGWKVVIRTDLLYEAEGFGEFAPGKKRKIVVEEDTCGVNKLAKVV